MSRKNIFDLLHANYDYKKEIQLISNIFNNDFCIINKIVGFDYKIKEFINNFLLIHWKEGQRFIDCNEIEENLKLSTDINMWNFDDCLIYLEYILNLIYLFDQNLETRACDYDKSNKFIIMEIKILNLLEKFNYTIKYFEKEEIAIIVEKNPAATEVAELMSEDENSLKVIEYNRHLLKGDIIRKKEILSSLSKELELIKTNLKQNNYSSLYSDVNFLLNKLHIRHNNVNEALYKNLEENEVEEWCDKTYEMLLCAFITNRSIELTKEIKELKEI